MSRDGSSSSGNPLAIVGPGGDIQGPNDENEHSTSVNDALPEGWEERKTSNGRIYYVNHVTKSTQWDRPTAVASAGATNNQLNNNQHTILTQQTQQSMPQQNGSVNSHATDDISSTVNNGISAGPSKVTTNGSTIAVSQSNGHTPAALLNLGKENCSPSRTNEQQPNMNWSVRVSSGDPSISPSRVPSSDAVTTPISPSSSGSHLSPVTPKSLNELLGTRSPDEPNRIPTTPVASNQNPVNTANATQQQIANLVPQINHSLVLESPQRATGVNANSTADQEPTSLSSTSNQRSSSDAQSPSQTTATSAQSEQPNGNSAPAATTSPTTAVSHNNQNQTRDGAAHNVASNATPSNGHARSTEISANPLEHNSPATSASVSRTVTDGGVLSSTPRAIDVHSQRTRRSSRNLEDSSRRRSSRTSRQSTSNAPAVNLVRSGTAFTRPSMDLPLGYGEYPICRFRIPFALFCYNSIHFPSAEMRTTQQGQVYFYHIPTGVSTWHDPRIPRDFDSQNLALDSLGPLPSGWEQRKTASGRVYYVDHNNRTTQFTDPRLNGQIINLIRRQNQPPAASASASTTSPATPASTAATATPPAPAVPTSSSNAPAVVANGRGNAPVAAASANTSNGTADGTRVLQVSTSSQSVPADLPQGLEGAESLPKYRRDLDVKLRVLRTELQSMQPQSGHCRLEVSRTEIFEESYRLIMKMRPKDMRKRLMVKFRGEEGLDYGGVAREWLHLLSREMLNPQYGLFQYSRDDHYTLQINPDSGGYSATFAAAIHWFIDRIFASFFFLAGVNPDHLSYFHFVGRTLGIAVFHGHCLDGGFTTPFYKQLLNKPITLSDIEGVDPGLHRSLTWMQ